MNAVAEAYPDLKANPNFLELQSQLAETENQISFARQYYNDAVASLNKLVMTIPWMLFTGIAERAQARVLRGPRGPAGRAAGVVRHRRAGRPGRARRTGSPRRRPRAPAPATEAPAAPPRPADPTGPVTTPPTA